MRSFLTLEVGRQVPCRYSTHQIDKSAQPVRDPAIILAGPLTLGFALVVKVLDPGDFVSVYDPLALNNAQGAGRSVYAGVGTKT